MQYVKETILFVLLTVQLPTIANASINKNRFLTYNKTAFKKSLQAKKNPIAGSIHLSKYREKVLPNSNKKDASNFPYQWVSSSSFALSSDLIYDPNNPEQLSSLKPESVIYVESGHLPDFQKQSSKLLHHKFIIISGTDTKSTPSEIPELNTQLLLQNHLGRFVEIDS